MTYKKLTQILLPSEQYRMFGLILLMLIAMLLEMTGIGMVIPTIAVMTTPNLAESYPLLKPSLTALGNPSQAQLVVWGMGMLAGVYLAKTFFLMWMIGYQNKFVFSVQASLSKRLFTGYLHQPWSFHLQRNSAQLITNATVEVGMFISNSLQPCMTLLSEGLALIGILILLFAFNPLGAITTFTTLGCAIFTFQYLVRHRILRWGEARQHHEKLRILNLQQGLGGMKDVKLLGREDDFLQRYAIHNQGYALIARKQKTLLEWPRLLIEMLAVTGLAILTLTMTLQNKSMTVLLPTVGLFAAAAFRTMPSLNRMLGSIQSIRYGLPTINHLLSELKLFNKALDSNVSKKLFPLEEAFVLTNIDYIYPNSCDVTLKDINLTIPRGASIGFIGTSGAGKSTLIDIILGLLRPNRGDVKCDGVNIQSNLRGWQDQMGYVPQSIYLTDDTLRQNIAFGVPANEIDNASVDKALKAAQLNDFITSLPEGLETMVGERGVCLSGGQKQRIGIARALYHDPAVLVLDEASSALDSETEKEVMHAINGLHGIKTILIVAHRLSTISNCDWIYKLEQGRIVQQGSFKDMMNQASNKYLGEESQVDLVRVHDA